MQAKNLTTIINKLKGDILKEVNDRLPRKVGVIAVNHFRQNFRESDWLDGLYPWPFLTTCRRSYLAGASRREQ